MLVNIKGRNVCCDILGGDSRPVICLSHSLAADSGMWAEQVPALLAADYRVLRIDMRGHGGSAPASAGTGGSEPMRPLARRLSGVDLSSAMLDRIMPLRPGVGDAFGPAEPVTA